jgi:hypothetical protein
MPPSSVKSALLAFFFLLVTFFDYSVTLDIEAECFRVFTQDYRVVIFQKVLMDENHGLLN